MTWRKAPVLRKEAGAFSLPVWGGAGQAVSR